MNRLLFFVPIGLFLGLVAYFIVGLTLEPGKLDSVLIDKPLPSFELEPIQGFDEGLANADFAGEVALVNIFGSWCVACLVEHPKLMEISQDDLVPIYGVNWRDKPGDGYAWLNRHGNPYTRIGDDPDSRLAIDLGVTGAPETFIVDQNGRIRYKHLGPISEGDWDQIMWPLIQRLRAE